MDRLTSLIVFGRVVESGGFSAAARRLQMSTTMVSNHVQALEDHLGARLLNRSTRKVSLTDIGRAYYERSTQILADLEEADRIATALHATPRGLLRLNTNVAMAPFVSPILAEFVTLYPAVTVDLVVEERMVNMIEDGFDLAIRAGPPPTSDLVIRRLSPWRHLLCCAPAYLDKHPAPAHPADLAQHNCLRFAFYAYGDDWRFDGPDGQPVSVRVGGNLVTNSVDALRQFVLGGHGVFLAPSFVIADDVRSGALVRLLPDYRPVEFGINAIYPHRHHLSAKVRAFLDLLAARFVEHQTWMNPGSAEVGGPGVAG